MTVDELLHRVSSKELAEWAAFEMIEGPIGPWRDDHRAALVASMVAALGGSKKSIDAFIPKWDQVRVRPSQSELRNKAFGVFGQLTQSGKSRRH